MGKLLIFVGIILIILGVILYSDIKIPYLGKLPGDIVIKKEGFTMYIPITTSILLSILLTVILYFIQKLKG
ncbi:MAG: DUF2905 domain-containing protein [Fulvivirga sp.]|nr:DUF2905 domain-containing protein [Fulvivirga sp.]